MEVMPHLKLRDDLGIPYAILPGDPARVDRIAEQLEDVEELEFNREYKSIAGTYKGMRVLAVSTGIGGPSTGIAVEELARILGGAKITDAVIENAREMKELANHTKKY